MRIVNDKAYSLKKLVGLSMTESQNLKLYFFFPKQLVPKLRLLARRRQCSVSQFIADCVRNMQFKEHEIKFYLRWDMAERLEKIAIDNGYESADEYVQASIMEQLGANRD